VVDVVGKLVYQSVMGNWVILAKLASTEHEVPTSCPGSAGLASWQLPAQPEELLRAGDNGPFPKNPAKAASPSQLSKPPCRDASSHGGLFRSNGR
jgi:hypothetical protein